MRRGPARAVALACAVALLAPAISWAQPAGGEPVAPVADDARYRELIRDAVAEYDGGRSEEALALFEQAFALRPSARVLRGMAKAQFELSRYARAAAAIDRALESPVDPLTEAMRQELLALRERALRYVGKLLLVVVPPGASVVIDGRPVSAAELERPIALDVGAHTVEAHAPGYRELRRRVEVGGGSSARLELGLQREAAPATALPPRTDTPPPSRAPLYVSAAVGIAGAAGVVAGALWLVDRSGAADRCADAARAGARCENAGDIASARDASMWTLGGSAAITAGAAVAFFVLLADDGARPRSGAAVPCAPGRGCGLRLRF